MTDTPQGGRGPWLLLASALVAGAAFLWWSSPPQAETAFGRLTYPRFWAFLACLAGALAVAAVALARRRRRRQLQITALTLGILVPLAAAEWVASRLPPRVNPFYLLNESDLQTHPDLDPRLPFTRPAHLQWTGWTQGNIPLWLPDEQRRQVTFTTDADGFRNSTTLRQADLVFLGDSFTEAGNVAVDESFVQLTALALQATARNLGIAGYSPPPQQMILERYALPCRPRVIVWQIFEGNDLGEAQRYAEWAAAGYRRVGLGQGKTPWEQWSLTHVLYRACVSRQRYWLAGAFSSAANESLEVRFHHVPVRHQLGAGAGPAALDEHPGWQALLRALEEGQRLAEANGIRLLILFIPPKLTVLGDLVRFDEWSLPRRRPRGKADGLMSRRLAAFCGERGLAFLDATEPLHAAAVLGQSVYLPTDTHLSPDGHRVLSAALVERLRPLLRQD